MPGIGDEAEKLDVVFANEVPDLGQGHLVFLRMEKHVAALADGEEVEMLGDLACRLTLRQLQNILPASPDIPDGRPVSTRGNEGARGIDVVAAELAVEAETHEAA